MTRTPWPTLAAIGIVATAGIAQALRSDPRAAAEAREFSRRLERACPTTGPWESRAMPMNPRELEAAEIDGCLVRRYARPDGAALTVMLVCGRPGPIAVHTPDVCYASAGFRAEGPPTLWLLDPEGGPNPSSFLSATFAKPGAALPVRYQILWSWSDSGAWSARDEPRLAFAGASVLCKLYVIRELRPGEPGGVDGSTVDFLRRFLPDFRQAQFAGRDART